MSTSWKFSTKNLGTSSLFLDRVDYFINIAFLASRRSKCLSRQVGAVLVSNDHHILSVGYNGPPKNVDHCKICKRETPGEDLHLCYAVHAEANALLQCNDMNRIESLFSTHKPCQICMNMLLNTNCEKIYYIDDYPNNSDPLWLGQGRELIQLDYPGGDWKQEMRNAIVLISGRDWSDEIS